MKRALLEAVVAARAEKRAVALITPLDGSEGRLITREQALAEGGPIGDAAERAFATDESITIEIDGKRTLVKPFNPPLSLIIVGAVHLAEPLSAIAARLGYGVTIVDPREAFARAERWPSVRVIADWPEDVLPTLSLDHRAAVVALSHDPKIDDPALEAALKSPAFYVGALGSGKTHASRLKRLGERGFDAAALARIHGPVGLKIGARSPGEIAVSIIAQMTASLRRAL